MCNYLGYVKNNAAVNEKKKDHIDVKEADV